MELRWVGLVFLGLSLRLERSIELSHGVISIGARQRWHTWWQWWQAGEIWHWWQRWQSWPFGIISWRGTVLGVEIGQGFFARWRRKDVVVVSHRHTRHVIHIGDGRLMVERCRGGVKRCLATWCVIAVEVTPTLVREDGLVAAILALAALVISCLLGRSIKRTT